jgi:ferredoxin
MFNILRASVSPGQEGLLVLELTGERADYDRGIQFLRDTGIQIQPLSQDVLRDESRCTHCGACVTVCPADAFTRDPKTQEIAFDHNRCVLCGLCVKACPPHAMSIVF